MSELKRLVASIAPTLGTALGGPLAGVATRYLANEWLGRETATEDDLIAAIQGADSNEIIELRKLDAEFKTELERLGVQDRADARARDLQRSGNNWRADFLALIAIVGLVLCVWFIARDTAMPERAVNAIMFVAGILAAAVRDVYAFEFGSSRGSKEKDDIIKRMH
jgi:Flp pilus assembly protein TadB